MQVAESLLIELVNLQRDIGMYNERIDWLDWRITYPDTPLSEQPFLRKRLANAESGLNAASERLRVLYKELYVE